MAYTTGDTILDNHYNDFATSVNTIWGTGSSVRGYGQTSTVSSVSAGTTITATQWATLLNRIRSISDHQGNDASITVDTVTNPTAGNTISVFSTLSADIGTIDSSAATATNAAGFGTAITDTAALATSLTGTITQTNTLTFASANQMRYGFNAGGKVEVSWSLSGGTSDDKYNNWVALATACGTYQVLAQSSGKSGGSGSTNINGTNFGWHDLTGSYQTVFRQYEDTGPYTASYIQLDMYKTGGSVLLRSYWVDGAADQTSYNKSIYNVQDQVDGTKTTTFGHEEPTTTYISDTWGDGPSQTVNATG